MSGASRGSTLSLAAGRPPALHDPSLYTNRELSWLEFNQRVLDQYLAAYFKTDVFPLLTPLAFDPGHPFPLISNRSKNFAVAVRHNRRTKFARVKLPDLLPRFVRLPSTDGPTFAFLEDVIRQNLHLLFPTSRSSTRTSSESSATPTWRFRRTPKAISSSRSIAD